MRCVVVGGGYLFVFGVGFFVVAVVKIGSQVSQLASDDAHNILILQHKPPHLVYTVLKMELKA